MYSLLSPYVYIHTRRTFFVPIILVPNYHNGCLNLTIVLYKLRKLLDLFTEFITNIDTINVTVIDNSK